MAGFRFVYFISQNLKHLVTRFYNFSRFNPDVYSPGVVHPDDVGDAFKKQCKLVQVRFPVTYGTYGT